MVDDGLPQLPRAAALTAAMFKDSDGSGRHRRMISGTPRPAILPLMSLQGGSALFVSQCLLVLACLGFC
jgi:hypothetical protein